MKVFRDSKASAKIVQERSPLHRAAVVGNKMVVVGGESGNGTLDYVRVLNFDEFSWTTTSSNIYLSPTSLPLKIPTCKGHRLAIVWYRLSVSRVRAFDTETECWSLKEAKGDILVRIITCFDTFKNMKSNFKKIKSNFFLQMLLLLVSVGLEFFSYFLPSIMSGCRCLLCLLS